MPSSLRALVAAPPSGRARPLLIDADAYATAVIRQGVAMPWSDIASLTGHVTQVGALLGPDAVHVDVAAWYGAHVEGTPDLMKAMGARTRSGYALRTMLGDEPAVERLVTTVRTLATSSRRQVILQTPSPARWLSRAHALAGTALEEVTEDQADSAAMYVAEWLGRLGSVPAALVLLDASGVAGDAPVRTTETLAAYTAIANVAEHFDWTLALRVGGTIEVAAGQPTIALLEDRYWTDDATLPDADVLLTAIPAQARPEYVLDQLKRLR